MKCRADGRHQGIRRRTPYGVRGLKPGAYADLGLPELRRTPYGVRGLKSTMSQPTVQTSMSRTPYGVRGLKFDDVYGDRPVTVKYL